MVNDQLKANVNEQIFARGKIFELVHETQPDGRVFETARRAPGVRLIIIDKEQKKILLTKEYRKELDAWDNRLPGGKVFDSLEEYDECRNTNNDILTAAIVKAKAEGLEEAGLVIKNLNLFQKSTLGATVEWDLFVFEVEDWSVAESGQQLEEGEQIEANNWVHYKQVKTMILKGGMHEGRIALVLLQWLSQQEKNNEI